MSKRSCERCSTSAGCSIRSCAEPTPSHAGACVDARGATAASTAGTCGRSTRAEQCVRARRGRGRGARKREHKRQPGLPQKRGEFLGRRARRRLAKPVGPGRDRPQWGFGVSTVTTGCNGGRTGGGTRARGRSASIRPRCAPRSARKAPAAEARDRTVAEDVAHFWLGAQVCRSSKNSEAGSTPVTSR